MVEGVADIEPMILESMNAKITSGGQSSPAELIKKIAINDILSLIIIND